MRDGGALIASIVAVKVVVPLIVGLAEATKVITGVCLAKVTLTALLEAAL